MFVETNIYPHGIFTVEEKLFFRRVATENSKFSAWKNCRFNVWCTRVHIISFIRVFLKTYFPFCTTRFTEYLLACIVQFWCQLCFFLPSSAFFCCCIISTCKFEALLSFAKQIHNLSRIVFLHSRSFNAFFHYLIPRFFAVHKR
jgi:hypothetical protein